MFEAAELGAKLSKAAYERETPGLREALLAAQAELAERRAFPVVLLVGGVDGAGKGETVNTLTEWMDPRLIQTNAMGEPSEEERERPAMWRFWRALPPKGRIGVFFGSWYTEPLLRQVEAKADPAALEAALGDIVRFERMLADEGALLLKFWLHLSAEQQKRRLKALEKDPRTRWRVTPSDWERFKLYDRFRAISERAVQRTNAPNAPWIVVEGADAHHREATVGRALLSALRVRLDAPKPTPATMPPLPPRRSPTLLDALDLSQTFERRKYGDELERLMGRLNALSRHKRFGKISVVATFEGPDAAGKGGAIKRVTQALDARFYRVVPIAAPTDEERAQPYLWRFWRQLPRRGHVAIFDRSWYGRVLVERVEGFAAEAAWRRAYGEINDFEDELARHGVALAKFWLQIDKAEQARRFKERASIAHKRFKLTPEDWRNRRKWDAYQQAVCDMVENTGAERAPWTLVEANDKRWARIKVLRTMCERIEAAL